MSTIWMGIAPGPRETRVIGMQGASETILKARLLKDPAHPRALQSLLEAIALWQGLPVRAALAVDAESNGYGSSLCNDLSLGAERSALYTLDWALVPHGRGPKRRDISGMGEFSDLRQLLLLEVAR
jgi:hypothetical protein